MEIDMNKEHWSNGPCPQYDCRKKKCECCGLKFLSIPSALSEDMTPENGCFENMLVRYEDTGEIWIYTAEGIPVLIKEGRNGA